jgi:hypothetical protein
VVLDGLILRPAPGADLPAEMPGGLVPPPHQDPCPLDDPPRAAPGEQGGRDVAQGAAVDQARQDLVGVAAAPRRPRRGGPPPPSGRPARSVAGAYPRANGAGRAGPDDPTRSHRQRPGPRREAGQPRRIQAGAGLCLTASWGSGRVIQRGARRPCTPSRVSAGRIVSMLTRGGVTPPFPTDVRNTRMGTGRRPRGDRCGKRWEKLCSMAAAHGKVSAHWRMDWVSGTTSVTRRGAPVPRN